MSRTIQTLSKTLVLPAIGSFQYLAAVDPELQDANGNALPCYIDTPDADLSFTVNADGTIDIYNVAGKNLAAGKRIVVSSLQKQFNAPVGGELTVTTVASTPPVLPVSSVLNLGATAVDNLTFSNTPTIITFDASSLVTLISQGYIEDPGVNGGAFVVRKPGNYQFQGIVVCNATAGGAGTISVQMFTNGTGSSLDLVSRTVNFAGGVTDRVIPIFTNTLITQAAIDSGGGARTLDWRIFTSAGTITGKLGGGATTTTRSSSLSVTYLGPDYLSAP